MIPCQQVFLPDDLFPSIYNLFVLREDLYHVFVSGNKWRKLKYYIKDIQSQGYKAVLTFGGAYSNHLLAVACAGAMYGFKTIGIVRGEPVQNFILFLCKQFGMELHFVSRSMYKDKKECFNNLAQSKADYYFLDEGGAGELGVKGCMEIWENIPTYIDHVFCACGTGTTLAGILAGKSSSYLHTHVHGVAVLKAFDSIKKTVLQYGQNFYLHTEYTLGGYAKTTTNYLYQLSLFSRYTGILLDPIYTGKVWWAIQDLAQRRSFAPGSNILIVHTGGLTGMLGLWEKYPQ
ncbi:MAG: pyridoxal-phosphate dependent enzyme [Bacteroidia bacterium]|nr:pyridoxal-phosphate dependent enzyme [Bacteroidia bacterium]MDW8301329.1 pyridoxal-phosphate dependent enzyme [Bacteroidia bacterium]